MLRVVEERLPHVGIIPGARGHKKVVIPKGTSVFCVRYYTKYFWAAYLDRKSAQHTCETFKKCKSMEVLLEWNFMQEFPTRIIRSKEPKL
jgi:hypothetical protein